MILEYNLKLNGFEVYLAENGPRGVELARQKRPELIDWVGLTNRCNNNEQVIRAVTETFFEGSPANIEALTEAIKNNEKSVCKK